MSRLEAVRGLIAELTPTERAQVMLWLASLGSESLGVEHTRGVCGGAACLLRTRIPVWVLVRARQLGNSESDLLNAYPSLRVEDLRNAWAYYEGHREEIDRLVEENERGVADPGPALRGRERSPAGRGGTASAGTRRPSRGRRRQRQPPIPG